MWSRSAYNILHSLNKRINIYQLIRTKCSEIILEIFRLYKVCNDLYSEEF